MFKSKKYCGLISVLLIVVIMATAGCTLNQETGAGGAGDETTSGAATVKGWTLIPINMETEGGLLRVDFAVLNSADDWGSIAAADPAEKPTKLTKDGKEYSCDTVQVSSGGHYLPPGFQMKGYTNKKGEVQSLYVECKVDGDAAGGALTIPATLTVGEYDYYEKGVNVFETQLKAELGEVSSDLTYPGEIKVKVHTLSEEIPTLNKTTLANTGAERTDEGITMQWAVTNPGEYGTKVHIGKPPVLGNDGIVYGARVSPDIVDVPMAKPDGGVSEFETSVEVPKEVESLYMLLSVEQSRERLFSNYLVDLSGLQ